MTYNQSTAVKHGQITNISSFSSKSKNGGWETNYVETIENYEHGLRNGEERSIYYDSKFNLTSTHQDVFFYGNHVTSKVERADGSGHLINYRGDKAFNGAFHGEYRSVGECQLNGRLVQGYTELKKFDHSHLVGAQLTHLKDGSYEHVRFIGDKKKDKQIKRELMLLQFEDTWKTLFGLLGNRDKGQRAADRMELLHRKYNFGQ